jgi:glycosyltransferase involved in cell wall biosynthesis
MVIHTPKNPCTAVYNCFRQLADYLEEHGHRATIVSPEDFPLLRTIAARWYPMLYPLEIARWLSRRGKDYDLVLFHSYSGWLVQTFRNCIAAWKQLHPITFFHGLEPIHYESLKSECERAQKPLSIRFRLMHGAIIPRLIRLGCIRSDRVICLNSQEAAYLKRGRWGQNGAIARVANGVPQEFFVKRSYATDSRRLLFVGQWVARKGVSYLVNAFTTIARQVPGIELRCVGTMTDEQSVVHDFPADIRSRVSVRCRIPREELVAEYAAADIFLFPTLFEGFSIALIEAMAAGLPIVTTSVGAAPDLLHSGSNAILVPLRDSHALSSAIHRLLGDRELCKRLGRQAQATAAQYELGSVHRHIMGLLEDTVFAARVKSPLRAGHR